MLKINGIGYILQQVITKMKKVLWMYLKYPYVDYVLRISQDCNLAKRVNEVKSSEAGYFKHKMRSVK